MDCPKCDAQAPEKAEKCEYCGTAFFDRDGFPTRLQGFNFGAFTLTWLWAVGHGLDGWGIVMLLLFPFNIIVMVRVAASGGESPLFLLFPLMMIIKWVLSLHLGCKGNKIVYRAMPNINIHVYEKNQKLWGVGGVVYMLLFIAAFVIIPPPLLRSRSKANYIACKEQLKNIASGMEEEISAKGSLKNIHSVEDVCLHILSGYDKPSECRGEVEKRVEEVCLKGSLRFKKIDEKKYEIKAKSNEKIKCNICVTETAVSPAKYGPEECAATKCVH